MQVGAPRELYRRPNSRFVASFLGETNFIPGVLRARDGEAAQIETPVGVLRTVPPESEFEIGAPVWCGGMLETGIGRAANAALAALPGFTLPGDISASARFYERDIVTEPAVLEGGHVRVPTGPGLGVEIDEAALEAFTVQRERLTR